MKQSKFKSFIYYLHLLIHMCNLMVFAQLYSRCFNSILFGSKYSKFLIPLGILTIVSALITIGPAFLIKILVEKFDFALFLKKGRPVRRIVYRYTA